MKAHGWIIPKPVNDIHRKVTGTPARGRKISEAGRGWGVWRKAGRKEGSGAGPTHTLTHLLTYWLTDWLAHSRSRSRSSSSLKGREGDSFFGGAVISFFWHYYWHSALPSYSFFRMNAAGRTQRHAAFLWNWLLLSLSWHFYNTTALSQAVSQRSWGRRRRWKQVSSTETNCAWWCSCCPGP